MISLSAQCWHLLYQKTTRFDQSLSCCWEDAAADQPEASDNKGPFKRSVLISFTHYALVFFQVNEWFNNNLISNPQEI